MLSNPDPESPRSIKKYNLQAETVSWLEKLPQN